MRLQQLTGVPGMAVKVVKWESDITFRIIDLRKTFVMEEIILTSHDLSLMTCEGVVEKSMKKKRGKKLNCFKKILQKVLTSSI